MASRFIPRSIRGRLLLAAFLFSALALLVASLAVGNVFTRFAKRALDDRLDAQIELLMVAVKPDGTLDKARIAEIGPVIEHGRGWGWTLAAIDATAHSKDFPEILPPRAKNRPWREPPEADRHLRSIDRQMPGGKVTVTAWAPGFVVERIKQAAVIPWAVALSALAAFLAVATFLQLRFGLKPLAQVKSALQAVRAGSSGRIPEDQPSELQELVQELNGLLDENDSALARAREHVANLAHSLKTPLATLDLKVREGGRDPDGELAGLVAQVEAAIRHHLGRARAASPGAPGKLKVDLHPALDALVAALSRIHADRAISVENSVPAEASLKCDPQDLDEMLGNLLDNAWKWAAARISIGAELAGGQLRLNVDDDGPGLSPEAIAQALVRGQRLDERDGGHGFGLPIARELAELHGGSLALEKSPLGGLRAILSLPR